MSRIRVTRRFDPSVFDEFGKWWNRQPGPAISPFLRAEWFALWNAAFVPKGSRLEVVAFEVDGDLVAVLPLVRSGLRRASMANSHTESFDLIGDPDPDSVAVVRRWLERRPMTRLYRLDGSSCLIPDRDDPGWVSDRHMQAPYLDLVADTEVLFSNLGRTLRGDLRRRERRLTEVGELVYLDDATAVFDDALERCLQLEARGWKGETGTAIISQPETEAFYRGLSEIATERGWLRLCALLVEDRLIAFQYNLDFGGRRYLLKSGFDEEMAAYSPGKVIQWRVLEAAASSGLSSYEFGGEADDWKMRWTDTLRPRINAIQFGQTGPGAFPGRLLRLAARRRSRRRTE